MREIRNRIKAVKSTGQITHAMELVAASKMKKAQHLAEAGRAYAVLLMDLTQMVGIGAKSQINDSSVETKSSKRLIIVFSTDKGLCGGLNTNLFRAISEIKDENVGFIAVGNRAARFLAHAKRNMLAKFSISDHVKFSETRRIASAAIKLAKDGKFGSIEVLYSLYVNTLRQEPTLVKIAPVDNLEIFINRLRNSYKLTTQERPHEDRMMNFEPSIEEIRKELPSYYINQAIYHMALDAKASEHSARMVAMKSASDNADKLVQSLTMEYNKARQNAITTEIIELSAAEQISE